MTARLKAEKRVDMKAVHWAGSTVSQMVEMRVV